MKKAIFFLLALCLTMVLSAQTSLNLLNLPSQYGITDNKVIAKQEIHHLKCVKTVDIKNRPKWKEGTKWVYGEPLVSFEFSSEIETKYNRTYFMNLASSYYNSPKAKPNGLNIDVPSHYKITDWIGQSNYVVSGTGIKQTISLGYSNNSINLVYNGKTKTYDIPVDILGKPIEGTRRTTSNTLLTNPDNPPISVRMYTKSIDATGKETIGKNYVLNYITKNDLKHLTGLDDSQLIEMTRIENISEDVNPSTHITNMAAKIDWSGNTGKLSVWYSGVNVAVSPPTKKTNSFNMPYQGTKYEVRVFDGTVNDKNYGCTARLKDVTEFTLQEGSKFSWNPTTKILTYDSSKPLEIWGIGHESGSWTIVQGKNQSVESYYERINGVMQQKHY